MAKFSHRDYLWIADQLRVDLSAANELHSGDARAQAINSIYRWAAALARQNQNFDKGLFIYHCGLGEGETLEEMLDTSIPASSAYASSFYKER